MVSRWNQGRKRGNAYKANITWTKVSPESELVGAFRVLGEPAFLHTFFLFEDFLDGPERREGKYAQQGGYQNVFGTEGGSGSADAQQKENPPAAGTPIVFRLHDNGVEDADDEKGADADD